MAESFYFVRVDIFQSFTIPWIAEKNNAAYFAICIARELIDSFMYHLSSLWIARNKNVNGGTVGNCVCHYFHPNNNHVSIFYLTRQIIYVTSLSSPANFLDFLIQERRKWVKGTIINYDLEWQMQKKRGRNNLTFWMCQSWNHQLKIHLHRLDNRYLEWRDRSYHLSTK